MTWIELNNKKDLPNKNNIKNKTKYYAKCKGIIFKIHFYKSLSGIKYMLTDYNDYKEESIVLNEMKEKNILVIDDWYKLSHYKEISNERD